MQKSKIHTLKWEKRKIQPVLNMFGRRIIIDFSEKILFTWTPSLLWTSWGGRFWIYFPPFKNMKFINEQISDLDSTKYSNEWALMFFDHFRSGVWSFLWTEWKLSMDRVKNERWILEWSELPAVDEEIDWCTDSQEQMVEANLKRFYGWKWSVFF